MKSLFKNIYVPTVAMLAAMLTVASCAKDDTMRPLWNEFGVISYVGSNAYFEIADDNGNYYIVDDNVVSDYGVAEGKRLSFAYYDYVDVTGDPSIRLELQDKPRVFDIRLERIEYVLSKPVIRESFILEDEAKRRDSIGYDGIRPYIDYGKQTTWFGGDFLNISFEYIRYEGSPKRHLISLVWDDVRIPEGEDDYVHLYLCHNAYGEVPSVSSGYVSDTGICSFDLTELIPESRESIKIKLFWDWYNQPGTETTRNSKDMGLFTPGSNAQGGVDTDSDTGHYYISPPANPTAFVM